MVILLTAGFIAQVSKGQNPVIVSFQGNGRVAWTNAVNSNAYYRVEWAAQAGGPWHTFTYQPIHTIDAHDSTTFEAEVPMFYRVVMLTNPPPQGMVWIDGGDVELGQIGIAEPVHTNFISGFWMDDMEMTRDKWDEVYNWAITNDYGFSSAGTSKSNNHPVVDVSWYNCVKWCNARSQKEGLDPCYFTDESLTTLYTKGNVAISNNWVNWSANGYRLPTEAEWEKAARGGRQGRLFPWGGDTVQHTRANYEATTNYIYDTSVTQGYHPASTNGGTPYTSPAGSFAPDGYGLHDMAGNVAEWCWDWNGTYENIFQVDPHGPTIRPPQSQRITRGGSYYDGAFALRCADRSGRILDLGYNHLGFRCVREQ